MAYRLQWEIEKLKKSILIQGALIEQSVFQAVQAVQNRDEDLAREIVKNDWQVDEKEVELEEECLKLLALYQPVAKDLRFIIAVLKINNELERIGDLAANIAKRAAFLAGRIEIETPFDLSVMAEKVQTMLKRGLDALVNMDDSLASSVCQMDDEVDNIHKEMYDMIEKGIKQEPSKTMILINYINISRNLERMGDSATNIAEDVIYLVTGEIVRHRTSM